MIYNSSYFHFDDAFYFRRTIRENKIRSLSIEIPCNVPTDVSSPRSFTDLNTSAPEFSPQISKNDHITEKVENLINDLEQIIVSSPPGFSKKK